MLTEDALEVFIHRRIVHRQSDLDPSVIPFKPQTSNIEVEGMQATEDKNNIAEEYQTPEQHCNKSSSPKKTIKENSDSNKVESSQETTHNSNRHAAL